MEEANDRWIFGLFLRLFACILGVTLLDTTQYIAGWCGDHGVYPFRLLKQKQREWYPSLTHRLLFWPSAWMPVTSTAGLRLVALGGSCCAFLYAITGHSLLLLPPGAVMLGIHEPCTLHWPWHVLTLELWWLLVVASAGGYTSLETIFYSCASIHQPSMPLLLALRVLLFRVLFGFGKLKFSGSSSQDRMYIRPFLAMLPIMTSASLPTYRHLPKVLFEISYAGFFFGEIVVPFAFFLPQPYRSWAAVHTMLLMLGIQITGNFGTFNALGAVISVALLVSGEHAPVDLSTAPFFTVLMLSGLCLVPLNSWIATSWFMWPAFRQALPRATLYFEFLSVWRICTPFGVFPPNVVSPIRHVHLYQVSSDGRIWTSLRYKFQPTRPRDKARFIPLLHPILDFVARYHSGGFTAAVLDMRIPSQSLMCRVPHAIARNLLLDGDVKQLFHADATQLLQERVPKFVRVLQQPILPYDEKEWIAKGDDWRILEGVIDVPCVSIADIDGPLLPSPLNASLDETDPCMTRWRRRSAAYQAELSQTEKVLSPLRGPFQQQIGALVDAAVAWGDINAAVALHEEHQQRYGSSTMQRVRCAIQRAAYRRLQHLEDHQSTSAPSQHHNFDLYQCSLSNAVLYAAGVVEDSSPVALTEEAKRCGHFVFVYLFARTICDDCSIYRIMTDARSWVENADPGADKVLPGGPRVLRELARVLLSRREEVRHTFSFNKASLEYDYEGRVVEKQQSWPWAPPPKRT
jgi:hypothetical protein